MSTTSGHVVLSKNITSVIPRLSYKFAQRFCVLDVSRLLWLDGRCTSLKDPDLRNYSVRLLSRQDVAYYGSLFNSEFGPSAVMRLESGQHFCCAAEDKHGLAAYLWLALGSVAAEHNRGRHLSSGVAITFPKDTAFVYQAYTRPDMRGQGLFSACLIAAHRALKLNGVIHLLSTTEWTNLSALKSFTKAGFQNLGLIWRFGWGNKTYTIAPTAARAMNIYFDPPDVRTRFARLWENPDIKIPSPALSFPPLSQICQLPLRDSSFRQRWD